MTLVALFQLNRSAKDPAFGQRWQSFTAMIQLFMLLAKSQTTVLYHGVSLIYSAGLSKKKKNNTRVQLLVL